MEVSVSYRQVNRKPRIEELMVDGESLLNGRKEDARQPGGRQPGPPSRNRRQPGGRDLSVKTIAWKASDPNDDELDFDLFYRGMDEKEWKEIDEDLRGETAYEWDTARVPDGLYLLKLVARDGEVRPQGEALADERVSRPLLVDNRRPTLQALDARRQEDGSFELSGVAHDEHGHVTKIEVSRNSGDWAPVFPADGLFDSGEEPFSFRTEQLEPGEHVFVFAATDGNQNTGTGKVVAARHHHNFHTHAPQQVPLP
jgi:hypothetical protein